ncbi:MAG: hypothetical protein HOG89_02765 [Candidatus Peribacter sp.]|jgi:uncharacterized membrane protein (GlpM family)|nr:hypothetical protein [Candidatus Peribacter sp.]MBT4392719.1 hypothetical protein [Candidatus Peribacter sp.]MBT4600664.1 hypothetical protein [Candidatus Peribacter sp.]MBT5148667.1 hypothetical protein [Candidatus Peribacter sp.]MBT5637738.1 hypothetical protein [Candidatus Peribacter sp.]
MAKSEDKLDQIIEHLQNIDRRDKLRMRAGFIKGLIGIIPGIAFIVGLWYFYNHGDEVMARIAKTAAEQAMEATKQGTDGLLQQLQNFQVK